jgi:nucleoside-diphosphate-sugar epimerase
MYFENATILRFGGLVGPQRQPAHFHKEGQAIVQPNAWVNMTHQADAIAAIVHVIRLESYGIFNVVSPEHVSRRDFYTKAYERANLVMPQFTEDEARGKRVLSDKIMQRLGFAFQYANPVNML